MKILFDCIVTTAPAKCSTTVQFRTLAEILLQDPDTYIYWPIPDSLDDEARAYYPDSPRIRYIPIFQYKDRMKEYNRIDPVLHDLLSFTGSAWDWDVLITVRTTQVPMMKVVSNTPRYGGKGWMKRIAIIENMMILSKKPTVTQSVPDVQDRLTLEAYMAADLVMMPAYHQKKWIREVAKQHFAPARVLDIDRKVTECCLLNLKSYDLKSEQFLYKGGRRLNLAFVGRLEKFGVRLHEVNEVMRNQFIMHSETVNPYVCTVTPATMVFDEEVIPVRRPHREEFWRICREETDLSISMSVDVEQSMSLLEPVAMGVPVLVWHAPWSEGSFGESYPFFIKSPAQAYAFVNEFVKDYAGMYAKFAAWHRDWFVPTYTSRVLEGSLYKLLPEFVRAPATQDVGMLAKNKIVSLLDERGGDEFVLFDLVEQLGETGELDGLADKVREGDSGKRSLIFSTPWNEYRYALRACFGWEDASTVTGHLKRLTARRD